MSNTKYVEDEDDVLIEDFNTVMFLLLGILSLFVSVVLLVSSATIAVYGQLLSMDFLYRSIFAVLFFVGGFGSLHIVRKRRESKRKKKAGLFLRTKA